MLTTTANVPPPADARSWWSVPTRPIPTPIKPYQEFTLSVVFENRGQTTANNLIVTFDGTDLLPRGTGGVSTTGSLGSAETK